MNIIYKRNSPYDTFQSHWHTQYVVFHHINFIKFLATWIKPKRYLEIGVYENECLNQIAPLCEEAYAVDIHFKNKTFFENTKTFETSSDTFFENLDKSIQFDLVFIDGCHSHEQSLRDFLNVKDRVIEDGFILLHDTYPIDQNWFTNELCGEVYKTIEYIKKHLIYEMEVLTLPFHPGLTIVKKMKINKQLSYKP